VDTLIRVYFAATLFIFVLKVTVAIYSLSLAVTASAVESAFDVLSNAVLWWSARIAKRENVRKWPIGKSRLEPLAIVIFSAAMVAAAVEIFIASVQGIIKGLGGSSVQHIDAVSFVYGSLGAVLAVKLALFIFCYPYHDSPSIAALSQDSLNDMASDAAALIAVAIVDNVGSGVWWLDPATAIAISVFFVCVWMRFGYNSAVRLVGHAASKAQLAQITYLAMNHDRRIEKLDDVRAYYVGPRLVVELDIVLPAVMPLREAHGIGEALRRIVEHLEYVERASVHLEYETSIREHDARVDEHDDGGGEGQPGKNTNWQHTA
jgi:cation diffusion facilitator family transporter